MRKSRRIEFSRQQRNERALAAFQAHGKPLDPAIETARFAFAGKAVTTYLRLPQGVRPAPIVFGINGLDSRKDDVIARVHDVLEQGIGVFAVAVVGGRRLSDGAVSPFSRT